MKLSHILRATADILMPRVCPVCGATLDGGERYVCRKCLMLLPLTTYEANPLNNMAARFIGTVPVEFATAYFFYERDTPYAQILQDIKYRNVPSMGRWLARRYAESTAESVPWSSIDFIIPVPLHATKLAKRGYNQALHIAMGISDATHIPIYEALYAVKAHHTQTHKSAHERMLNAKGLYAPIPEATATLTGKHVLLVDDVITTGATLLSCAQSLCQIPSLRVSFFTLAAARLT